MSRKDVDMSIEAAVDFLLQENARRNEEVYAKFNPITGEGSTFRKDRVKLDIPDFPIQQLVPPSMMKNPLIRKVVKAGSMEAYFEKYLKKECSKEGLELEYSDSEKQKIIEQIVRIRCKHDFAFAAAMYYYIKPKGEGGDDILFHLNRPQRRLVERYERKRLEGKPIRLILLKARQWGGSTCTQLYMNWLQMFHRKGLNSLIVAHLSSTSDEIQDMFKRVIDSFPVSMLHELGEAYNDKEPKFVGVGNTGKIHRVPQRNYKIKIGTAESPNSARGGDYNLVHCSEVGLWKTTDNKTPRQIVRSATSGILYKPYTMIVYESTANGVGNFFHKEYVAAKTGRSQFEAMFVAWWEIEQYSERVEDLRSFARELWINRENTNVNSEREVSGRYLWYLWTLGATLEGINWYIIERAKYEEDGDMAAEYPSDDIEAFVNSGSKVFDKYKVEDLRATCKAPKYIGEVFGKGDEGPEALEDLKFMEDHQGKFWVWALPEIDPDEEIKDRYLVTVDIGGRGKKSDWSVICVIDRLYQMEGGKPVVVAQWYGHIDMDVLAWKSAQIAKFYDNALLVIESNTLETHDKDRSVEGDQSGYILNLIKEVYDNLYARKQSDEEIRNQAPKKYGFHTNVATKPKLISNLVKVIRQGQYVERDGRALDEYLVYEQKQNGAYGAVQGEHDDLLMARAIAFLICFREMDIPEVIPRKKENTHKKSRPMTEANIS